jgi:hypothetical protein
VDYYDVLVGWPIEAITYMYMGFLVWRLLALDSGAYKVTVRRVRRIDEPLVRSPLDLDGSCPRGCAAARSDEDQAIIASATMLCASTVCMSNSATATASPAWLPPGVVDEPL